MDIKYKFLADRKANVTQITTKIVNRKASQISVFAWQD